MFGRSSVRGDALPPRNHKRAAVNLIFSHVHPSQASISLGPFNSTWLDSEGMRTGAKGAIRAPYRKHQWEVDGLSYFRLDCTAQVSMQLEKGPERSPQYGPYQRFSAVDGLAYGDDKVLAYMDQKSDKWLYYDSGHHWPVMVVSDIKAASTARSPGVRSMA